MVNGYSLFAIRYSLHTGTNIMQLLPTRRIAFLLTPIIAATLFPWGWLGKQLPSFDSLLLRMFPGALGHISGHTFIFLLLGGTLLIAVPLLRRPLPYFLVIGGFALAQEVLQLAYKRRRILADDLLDLVVDLLAATLAFVVWQVIAARQKRVQ
jgi:hypothetical protein